MLVKNFLDIESIRGRSHEGEGFVNKRNVFAEADFESKLGGIIYTEILPDSSIGYHTHEHADEELYIILGGNGLMSVNGEERAVKAGDIVVNPYFGSHGLKNTSSEELLKVLVLGVEQ